MEPSSVNTSNNFNYIKYSDLLQCLESKNLQQFEVLANYVDLNKLQQNNKPFIFHAIESNDESVIEFLLKYDLDLNMKYIIDLSIIPEFQRNSTAIELFDSKLKNNKSNTPTSDNNDDEDNHATAKILFSNFYAKRAMTAFEYAQLLEQNEISKMIKIKMTELSGEERLKKVINTRDLKEFKKFKQKFQSSSEVAKYVKLGFMRAIQINCTNLVEYFINVENVDVNSSIPTFDGREIEPLLLAIEYDSKDVVRYLIFRKANIHSVGKYGNALVTAIHFDASIDTVKLLLDKGASLTSRHIDWPDLSLRDYCVQFSKVKHKYVLDEFVCKLIANGKYRKLKYLAENGYKHLNVVNHLKKYGRDIAIEYYHTNIVRLIDKIEENERRLNTKMNYG